MKKVFKIIVALLGVLLLLCIFIYLFVRTYDSKAEKQRIISRYEIDEGQLDLINDGDIILRRGYGFVSDMIVRRLNEPIPVSHCAIVEINDSISRVIHSVSQTVSDFDGVQAQTLERFIKDSKKNSIIVVRFKYNEGQNASQITSRARHYLHQRVPFDMGFDITDTTKFYCTEFIWRIIQDEFSTDIFEKKREKGILEFYKFDVFLDTTYFDVVWSHQDL